MEAKTLHSEYKRIVPGAKQAVLFVHGINATPRFFDEYIAALPEDISVNSVLLPGHGGDVRDFGRHSAKEWESHVRAALEALRATHERVCIMAHSLGTLLAIREAVRDDRRIAGMLLLCVPLRIWSRPTAWWGKLAKGLGGKASQEELRTCYGHEVDARLWRYIGWIPRYLELFMLSREARQVVQQVETPTVVFMAGRDEQVSLRSEKCMAANPAITRRRMDQSTHHLFTTEDKAAVTAALLDMCS
ncbi:MAG: alpha/beta fold hydrolase [Clostridiales bacterium]|nr:alpha/beta fold hydrolase [Clostridiales bacterium]